MSNVITNNGPKNINQTITFTSESCEDAEGNLVRLIVCDDSAPACNASTDPQYIICEGGNSVTETPFCSYLAKESDLGEEVYIRPFVKPPFIYWDVRSTDGSVILYP